MNSFDCKTLPGARWITLTVVVAAIAAALTTGAQAMHSVASQRSSWRNDRGVEAFALQWFAQMQTAQIDRTQLAPDYSAQLTDVAVQGMSRYLREYKYGVSPTRAEILQTRTSREQKLYVVELLFPRGDAASLLFGFNTKNQITGVSLLSMAGD
jgi:hypothetical protein